MKRIKIDFKREQIECLIHHCNEICKFSVGRDDWESKLSMIQLYEFICELQKKLIGVVRDKYKVTIKPSHGLAFLALTRTVNMNNDDYHSFTINSVYNQLHQKLL